MAYAISEVLEWKFPNTEGIDTVDGVITKLPPSIPQPSEAEISQWTEEYIQYRNSIAYRDERKNAYDSIKNQLDMMYWDSKNNTTTWENHIDSVKQQFPKQEG